MTPATPKSTGLQVSVSITQTLVKALQHYAVDNVDALLQESGIDPATLAQPENRIDFACQEQLWQLAQSASGDEAFALKFAQQSQPASFNMAGYIAINSRTIGDAMDAVEIYQKTAGEGGSFAFQRDDQFLTIDYHPVHPEAQISPVRSCGMLAATLVLGRWLVGDSYTPQQVKLSLTTPSDPCVFEDFFQCPVSFEQKRDCMHFPRALEQSPIPHASLDLLQMMKQRAEKLIRESTQHTSMASQVSALIANSLLGQEPDRGSIADKLAMSQRTLQRKLAKEDTSYQEVLDQTRHRLAKDYLQQLQLTITDIAYLLGFTEPSAFYRAFKKWHGMTPGQYRDSL